MSFDRSLRRFGFVSGLVTLTLLAGCQVRPLYSEASGTGERLASVGFGQPRTRLDQVVRNQLVFLTSGGAGESAHPVYEVKLSTRSTSSNISEDEDNDSVSPTGVPVPGRVRVEGIYTITRISDGKILKSSKREVVSLIDVSGQGYASLRAVRDAENRAARELAEFIRAEIAIALAREPQPQTVWQK
ncbi:lipoprotein [Neorhizobium galegae]|uniref:Putative secreted (Periplasmic) protein n=1 Tax=Neorhizobium galegae bv. orientalis str. HAMBI 540 TaxID=1028800 RepID=A0A068SYG4_NEOGA|nr:lipoprotein [Neorhizobium galegae]CDN50180.1 Putative secreted (Periplasmic) protein [Neorhizobium galegae bv. orientalis str. HAMBI 540]